MNAHDAQTYGKVLAWRRERDPELRRAWLDEILHDRRKLIHKLTAKAARQEKSQDDFDDLFQAGMEGTVRALGTWDPKKGAFSTHAWWWIRHRVQTVTRTGRPIKLPRVRLRREDRDRALRRIRENPDVTAAELGVEPAVFRDLRSSFNLRFLSTSETATGERSRGARLLEARHLVESPEEQAIAIEKWRAVDALVARYVPGSTAESMGLEPPVFALLLDVINERRAGTASEEPMKTTAEIVALVTEKPKSREELATDGVTRAALARAEKEGAVVRGKEGRRILYGLPGTVAAMPKARRRKPVAAEKPAKAKPVLAKTKPNDVDALIAEIRAAADAQIRAIEALRSLPVDVRTKAIAAFQAAA